MDETTQKTLFGFLFAVVTGIYGFFIRHLVGHVTREQSIANKADIKNLFEVKQSKENCRQIVKRMDENHKETCKKLDRILDKLESV